MAKLFEKICEKGLTCLCIAITGIFSYWACRYSTICMGETYLLQKDSLIRNMVVLAVVFALLSLLSRLIFRGSEAEKKKRVLIITAADIFVVGILLCVWVAKSNLTPVWDQLQVYMDAIDFLNRRYEDINGYLSIYGQHYGLIFLEGIFLRFCQSYKILQYVNVVCILLMIWFLVMITEECFGSAEADFYCLIGITGMLPVYIYSNYVYGDISSVSLIVIAIWAMLRFFKRDKWGYLALCLACAVIALFARKNVLVMLIAMMIALLVHGIGRKNYKAVLASVLVLLLPLTGMAMLKMHYEHVSGYEISNGMPASVWIAMGLMQDEKGYGLYNGYNEHVFVTYAGKDPDRANERALSDILAKAEEFRSDPNMARVFFQNKLQEQWNEGSFTSLHATSNFEGGEVPKGFVEQVYYGRGPEILHFVMNYYLFILYTFAFVYWIVSLRKENGILTCVMGIALVGGVAFSLMWEAKSRYVLGYVIMLIPYAAMGIRYAQTIFSPPDQSSSTCPVCSACK